MVVFVDEQRDVRGVEPICKQLPIAPSTYYEQKARAADPDRFRERSRRELKVATSETHQMNHAAGELGAIRLIAKLRRPAYKARVLAVVGIDEHLVSIAKLPPGMPKSSMVGMLFSRAKSAACPSDSTRIAVAWHSEVAIAFQADSGHTRAELT